MDITMKTIKRLLNVLPQWVLCIGFLVVCILFQIGNDIHDWYRGIKD
jgi:hypothetical protein